MEAGGGGGSEPPAGEGGAPVDCSVEALQLQLSEALAEIENIKAIATVSESTKQEAIDQVKQHCQEEVASLQTIMKESISNYEAQLRNVEKERSQWRQFQDAKEREIAKLRRHLSGSLPQDNLENEMRKAQEDAEKLRSIVMPMEQEIASLKQKLAKAQDQLSADSPQAPLTHRCETETPWREEPLVPRRGSPREWGSEESDSASETPAGADTFAANCAGWTTASGPAPSPLARPLPPGKEDTASLLSTGTLVPESIYLPPPGCHLLHDEEWNELHQEVKQHQVSLHQTRGAAGERDCSSQKPGGSTRQSSVECGQEVALLKDKVDSSMLEIQRLKEMFTLVQDRTQKQMAQLMGTHKVLCGRMQHLLMENQKLKTLHGPPTPVEVPQTSVSGQVTQDSPSQSGRPEENVHIAGELTLAPAAESSHVRNSELLTGLQEKTAKVATLHTLCNQQRLELQARMEERADLMVKLQEEKAKGQRLQIELDTSEQVQKDFVKLSQALQVRLEQIRQADSIEAIRLILDSVTNLKDASQLRGPWDQGS
ncbi:LOW QUALITY PROTEIN: rab GTPase-binding effector protein 2-like [Carcharodon carcharias]|uniref:LOW QUALITY PROTEIN: rab GTPase-binding effector protein 2-like n=1 Tax=Carcharodon carcharias TaxID=13397 RepID=UPI001B7EA02A|nr:LOW QUALITY PROTEIN: rab GTPase-binding effector protein 2-like [Carcharodon carcharias]